MAESYRDLLVWQRAIQMTLAIYRLTAGFPKEELFGLTSQIRRAGVSVASNIAEGYGRMSNGGDKQIFRMAPGPNLRKPTQFGITRGIRYGKPTTRKKPKIFSLMSGKI